MNILTNDQINDVIRSDYDSAVAINDYSPEIYDLLRQNWGNVRNQVSLTAGMACSEVTFRLASNRPLSEQATLNFWPATLDLSPFLFDYLRGIFQHYFIRQRKAWRINFSCSMAIISLTKNTQNFVWASRSNHQALGASFLIHNNETLTHFLDVILKQYSLLAAMEQSIRELEANYEDGLCYPASIVFHITNESGRIFGQDPICMDRGISRNACESAQKCRQNKCVWLSLSCLFTVNWSKPKKRDKKKKIGIPNRKIAAKLEIGFHRWLKKKQKDIRPFSEWKAEDGFPVEYLHLLETYLQTNIVLINEEGVGMTKLGFDTVEKLSKRKKTFSAEFVSSNGYKESVYLLTQNNNHVKVIMDLDEYMKKYHCIHCGRCFSTRVYLMSHRSKKVCEKKRFGGERLVPFKSSLEKSVNEIEELKSVPMCRDLKYGHILVNGKSTGAVSLDVKMKLKNKDSMTIRNHFASLKESVNYVIQFGAQCAVHVLGERMGNNVMFLKELESLLNKNDSCSKNDIDTRKLAKLKLIKNDVLSLLSNYDIYLSIANNDCDLPSAFMYELLSQLSHSHKNEDIKVKFEKSKLQTINAKKHPVKFILLNNFTDCFNEKVVNRNHFQLFENCVQIFNDSLKINIVGMESATRIGRVLSGDCLTDGQKNMFYSPSVAFYRSVDCSYISCGLLNAQKTVIHSKGKMKGALAIDMEKFYSSLFMTEECPEWLLTGLPREYVKDGTYFVADRSRRGKTFANVIIHAIEVGCGSTESVSLLHGRERKKFGMFFDAVMKNGDEDVYIEINGCLHHGHDSVCHGNNVSPEHKMACDTCRTDEIPRDERSPGECLRPRLWHLKTNEQRNSTHVLRKDMTYDEVCTETKRKVQSMYEKSGKTVISIYECGVLYFWLKNTDQFFEHYGIPLRDECRGIQFGTFVEQLALQRYPLLKYGKLTQEKVVTAISEGDLNGFVKCSAKCGPISQANLGIHTPFFYKNGQGETERSYQVEEKIVSTILLKMLLNNKHTSDFEITKIDSIVEYQRCDKNPFSKLKKPFFSALENHKKEVGFVGLSKSCINNAIGCFGLDCSKFKKSFVMNENDIHNLSSLHLLSHGTKINDEKRIFHFLSNGQTINLRGIHMSLVTNGITKMLTFSLSFKSWYGNSHEIRTNTDGSVYGFPQPFDSDILSSDCLTSLILDRHLTVKMDTKSASEYLAFKKTYFKRLGVCPDHESLYMYDLIHCHAFKPRSCCIAHIHKKVSVSAKFEFVGNQAIIFSVNKLVIYNEETRKYYLKSGGKMDDGLFSVNLMDLEALDKEINNL